MAYFVLVSSAFAFYTPGLITKDYAKGTKLPVEISQVSTLNGVSYDWYRDAKFCSSRVPKAKTFKVGDALLGEHWTDAPFSLTLQKDAKCMLLCEEQSMSTEWRETLKLMAET
jgi:transmembrane 9 superfamily member 2/4